MTDYDYDYDYDYAYDYGLSTIECQLVSCYLSGFRL
jgi:hypothetical protein